MMRRVAIGTLVVVALALALWLAYGERDDARLALDAPVALRPVPGAAASLAPPTSERGAAANERKSVDSEGAAAENAHARWIWGSVVVPHGAPDEPLAVVMLDVRGGRRRLAQCSVAPDGSFRLPLPADARLPRLELESHWLYLPDRARVRDERTSFTLEPLLGGRVVGKLLVPTDAPVDVRELVGTPVAVGASATTLQGDLTFELEHVVPGDVTVWWVSDVVRPVRREILLAAGETATVELPVEIGVEVAGVVLDEDGEAVQGARLSAVVGGAPATATTDSRGTFRMRGLAPGELRLTVVADGLVERRVVLGELADRERRTGLEIVLARGSSLAGRIVDADGEPVAKVSIEIESTSSRRSHSATTDDEGRFRVSGLDDGPFAVDATRGAQRAAAEGVAAGTHDLELRLLPYGLSLECLVVDDTGTPLSRASVRAGSARAFLGDDAGGLVVLRGLDRGRTTVTARKRWHVDAQREVWLPSEPITLVLERQATVRGSVIGPDGTPVAGARVAAPGDGDRTDDAGRFRLSSVRGGHVELTASANGFTDAAAAVEVAPGGELHGVVLALGAGGRIEGVVEEAAGAPVAGRRVELFSGGATRTDDAGRFVFEGLSAGSYTLFARPTATEIEALGLEAEQAQRVLERKVRIDVGPGGTAHVTIPPSGAGLVTLEGRVLVGGAPFRPERIAAREGVAALWPGTAGGAGAYELVLPRPGTWEVSVYFASARLETTVEVPRPGHHELDLVFEAGAIEGRVLAADGSPAEGRSVRAQGEGWSYVHATTDAQGFFAMPIVKAGSYEVTSSDAEPVQLELAAGATAQVELRLPPAATLRGTVHGPGSGRIRVWIFDGDEGVGTAMTDELGRFEVEELTLGERVVWAETEERAAFRRVEVTQDTPPVDLSLDPATRLRITGTRASGASAPVGAGVREMTTDTPLPRSMARIWERGDEPAIRLPPGTYRVRAVATGTAVEERTITLAGEPEHVVRFTFAE